MSENVNNMPRLSFPGVDVHPTAIIESGAEVAPGCKIGAYSLIGAMARIGRNTEIGSHCEIGMHSGILEEAPLIIGESSLIRSGSIFYMNSSFGPELRTGHRVTVREGTTAGAGLQIGTLSDIQGHCRIGQHVRLHSNVFIAQSSLVGDFVWIFPYVVLTNDPHPPSEILQGCVIDDFAIIATMSTVLPGKRVHSGALVGAMTLVRDNVPEGSICVGVPGKIVGGTDRIRFKESGLPVYPWRRHFHRGYPDDIVLAWKKEFGLDDHI